jgi:hypothetical protein
LTDLAAMPMPSAQYVPNANEQHYFSVRDAEPRVADHYATIDTDDARQYASWNTPIDLPSPYEQAQV